MEEGRERGERGGERGRKGIYEGRVGGREEERKIVCVGKKDKGIFFRVRRGETERQIVCVCE